MVISAILGGWPSANVSSNVTEEIKQSVMAYYEKMPDNVYKIPEPELKKSFIIMTPIPIYLI